MTHDKGDGKMSGLKRPIDVKIRLDENELAFIDENVTKSGLRSREAYLRKMALGGQIIRLDLSEIHETLRLLGTATNKINQLAKRANETRSIYETDIIALRKQIQDAILQVRGILKVYQKVKSLFDDYV
jgi:Mg2+ and Co2+ transporter CorA